jgi:hypothetical protein
MGILRPRSTVHDLLLFITLSLYNPNTKKLTLTLQDYHTSTYPQDLIKPCLKAMLKVQLCYSLVQILGRSLQSRQKGQVRL